MMSFEQLSERVAKRKKIDLGVARNVTAGVLVELTQLPIEEVATLTGRYLKPDSATAKKDRAAESETTQESKTPAKADSTQETKAPVKAETKTAEKKATPPKK